MVTSGCGQENGKKVLTMAEYIEKNEVQKRIDSIATLAKSDAQEALMGRVLYCIDHIPAADVSPVRHGRWLNFYGDFSTAECDICAEIYEVSPDEPCRKEFFDAFKEFYKFCPNCGAKMNEEATDNG